MRRPWYVATLVALAAIPAAAATATHVSTLSERRSVAVTIYNQDLALVRDVRRVALPRGRSTLAFREVTAQIIPETAIFQSRSTPRSLTLLEQNFDLNLLTPRSLISAYVGKDVTIEHSASGRGARPRRERARILATNDGIVVRYADRIETALDGKIVYPAIPPNLYDRPTLSAELENTDRSPQDIELTYLTHGLNWHAEYVGDLAPDGRHLDLHGAIALQNTSGTGFANAAVTLVAGDVHFVGAPAVKRPLQSIGRMTARSTPAGSLDEYKTYTIGHATNLADRETKQIHFLTARAVPLGYEFEASGPIQRLFPDPLPYRVVVDRFATFRNRGGDLGIPLPAGTLRIYARDMNGARRYVASARLPQTPRLQPGRIRLGTSTDIGGTQTETDFHIVSDRPMRIRVAKQVNLFNARSLPVTVRLNEPVSARAIIKESLEHVRGELNGAWNITIPAKGSTTLTYEVTLP